MNRQTVPPVTTTWTPARAPSPLADVAVPVLTGLALALAAVLLLAAFGALAAWPWGIFWRLAIGAFSVSFAVGLCYGLHTAHGTLHQVVETMTRHDWDNSGAIGDAPADWVTTNQPQPLSAAERAERILWRFLTWSYRSGKTSLEAATAAGFSEPEWTECYRVLKASGVIRATRAGDNAGWVLLPQSVEACWAAVQQRGFYL